MDWILVYLTSIGWERTYEILREIELCLEWDSGLKYEGENAEVIDENEDDDLLRSFVDGSSSRFIDDEKMKTINEKEWQNVLTR